MNEENLVARLENISNRYNEINNELISRKSKLHILCFVDTSLQIAENLKHFLTLINKEKNKKIFLHIILTSNNYMDYPLLVIINVFFSLVFVIIGIIRFATRKKRSL